MQKYSIVVGFAIIYAHSLCGQLDQKLGDLNKSLKSLETSLLGSSQPTPPNNPPIQPPNNPTGGDGAPPPPPVQQKTITVEDAVKLIKQENKQFTSAAEVLDYLKNTKKFDVNFSLAKTVFQELTPGTSGSEGATGGSTGNKPFNNPNKPIGNGKAEDVIKAENALGNQKFESVQAVIKFLKEKGISIKSFQSFPDAGRFYMKYVNN